MERKISHQRYIDSMKSISGLEIVSESMNFIIFYIVSESFTFVVPLHLYEIGHRCGRLFITVFRKLLWNVFKSHYIPKKEQR